METDIDPTFKISFDSRSGLGSIQTTMVGGKANKKALPAI
jgi:hypothetical protein